MRAALVVVALLVLADLVVWKVHGWRHPPPSRLESTVRCFEDEKRLLVAVPAGDPLSATAEAGSLRTTVEGNGVIVALAGSQKQARKLEKEYRDVGGDLSGRLERRDRTVWLWDGPSSPTQRQAAYDCQY